MKDVQTFKSIYLEYYPQLVVYGRTISSDEQLIEDTIQELFVTLWQKRKTQVFHGAFDSYLFVSFRNNLIRKLKSKQRIQLGQMVDTSTEPDPLAEINFAYEEQLTSLLQKLPPRQKEVLFLRYFKNHSYREIASNLGISYQVARNFSFRAIQFLKKNMKEVHLLF